MSGARARVRLAPGWHINVENVDYGPGDVLEVDADKAAHLVSRGVSLEETKAKPRR